VAVGGPDLRPGLRGKGSTLTQNLGVRENGIMGDMKGTKAE